MKHRWLVLLIGCGIVFFIGFTVLSIELYRLIHQPMISASSAPIIVRVDKATSAASFARGLQSKHLIKSSKLFITLIRAQGLSGQLKAGIYQINTNESAEQFMYRVVNGDVLTESFVIIEGSTQKHIAAHLAQAPFLNYYGDDWLVLNKCLPGSHCPIASTPRDASNAQDSLREGLLLADTYRYEAGSLGRDLLVHANKALIDYLDYQWQRRNLSLPYKSPYELLIAASIIEKEAALPRERRLIAGVIVNRLQKNMPLQMDPTVIYGLGTLYTGKLSHADLQFDSPYNTYRYRGLPPTPIAMVGKDAIDAASHPQPTDYLYYVAKGDGSHHFSSTYEQQKQAIARYLGKTAP